MELLDLKKFLDGLLTKFTVTEKLNFIDDKIDRVINDNKANDVKLLRMFYDLFNNNDKKVEGSLQQFNQTEDDLLLLAAKGTYYQKSGKKNYNSSQVKKSIFYLNKVKENTNNIGYIYYLLARSYRILGMLSSEENEIKKCYKQSIDAMKVVEKISEGCKEALAYVYNQEGNIYLDRHDFIKAKESFDISNRIYDNAFAHNGLGNYYRIQGMLKSAVEEHILSLDKLDYKKNKKGNYKECVYPLNYTGDCYRYMENYEKAEEKYIEAIRVNSKEPYPWHGLGRVYYELGNRKSNNEEYYKIAEKYYEIALKLDKNFKYAKYSFAKVTEKMKKDNGDKALQLYKIALANYPKSQYLDQKIQSCIDNIMKRKSIINKINEIRSYEKTYNKPAELLPEEKIIVETVEKNIQDSVMIKKDSFTQTFLKPNYDISEDGVKEYNQETFELNILRRWNSYTPIITNGSKGGGYFIKTCCGGIVIDPGFSFIENFKDAGYVFADIDKILISHAHDDHTADLESICNLLYRYNKLLREVKIPKQLSKCSTIIDELESKENLENEKKRRYLKYMKRLKLYVSENVYKKYEPYFVNNKNCGEEDGEKSLNIDKIDYSDLSKLKYCHVYVVKPNETMNEINKGEDIKITPIKSKHKDIIGENGALGFKIDYKNITLVYTGDTGWSKELETQYRKIRQDCGEEKYIVLIAHLGGFKEKESDILDMLDNSELSIKNRRNIALETENQDNYLYDDHLGRLGMVKINEALKPNVCIISEFGEEFRGYRVQLTKIFQEAFGSKIIFIPADIGLEFNLLVNKIKVIKEIDRENGKIIYGLSTPENVIAGEYLKSNKLFYFEKDQGIDENDCMQALNEGFREERDEICSINKHKYLLKLFYDELNCKKEI